MRVSLRRSLCAAPIAAAILASACTQQQAPAQASSRRLYATDLAGGARVCTVNSFSINPGRESVATMTVGNDGGWCDIKVRQQGPMPYDAGLLTVQPNHGKVYIHEVGDDTRIDYTPDSGYAGPDTFNVTLLPGRPIIHTNVTVTR